MPGPPPPPPLAPPPPMMGAPPAFNPPKSSPDDRAALLKSIQKGAKLKKTVTNDKSAPMIGKVASSNPAPAVNNGGGGYGGPPMPNGMGLGGLFAGGMPKLKPTKNRLGINSGKNTNSNNSEQNGNAKIQRERSPVPPAPAFNFASIQNEVKKKLANDNRDRGPPPPTPSVDNVTAELNHISLQQSNSGSSLAQANHSTLHRKTQSNVNLSSLDNTLVQPSPGSTLGASTRSINHGKPNLAPKPPVLNGKPKANPPKRLVTNGKLVSRAQSMKSPRSPPVQVLDSPVDSAIKYGTVRNMSSVLSHSLGNNLNSRSKMTLNGRPSAPPPSVPGTPPHLPQQNISTPAPPSKTAMMKPPNHAPPPPPGALPQPPNHAPPPPPPHKTLPAKPSGLSLSSSQTPPPPPPPRNSSMRDQNQAYKKQSTVLDFEERFKDMFRSPTSFPKPPPFRNVLKIYSNRQGLKLIWNEWNKRKGCVPKHWVRHYRFSYNGGFHPPNCVR